MYGLIVLWPVGPLLVPHSEVGTLAAILSPLHAPPSPCAWLSPSAHLFSLVSADVDMHAQDAHAHVVRASSYARRLAVHRRRIGDGLVQGWS
jgi:hypothetical protein